MSYFLQTGVRTGVKFMLSSSHLLNRQKFKMRGQEQTKEKTVQDTQTGSLSIINRGICW